MPGSVIRCTGGFRSQMDFGKGHLLLMLLPGYLGRDVTFFNANRTKGSKSGSNVVRVVVGVVH